MAFTRLAPILGSNGDVGKEPEERDARSNCVKSALTPGSRRIGAEVPVSTPSSEASSRTLGALSPLASPWDGGARPPPASIYQQIPERAPAHQNGSESCCSQGGIPSKY